MPEWARRTLRDCKVLQRCWWVHSFNQERQTPLHRPYHQIRLHPDNLYREDGLVLNSSRKPLISYTNERRKPPHEGEKPFPHVSTTLPVLAMTLHPAPLTAPLLQQFPGEKHIACCAWTQTRQRRSTSSEGNGRQGHVPPTDAACQLRHTLDADCGTDW